VCGIDRAVAVMYENTSEVTGKMENRLE